jgi:hypothetical protein
LLHCGKYLNQGKLLIVLHCGNGCALPLPDTFCIFGDLLFRPAKFHIGGQAA